jgi:hypothetical protein
MKVTNSGWSTKQRLAQDLADEIRTAHEYSNAIDGRRLPATGTPLRPSQMTPTDRPGASSHRGASAQAAWAGTFASDCRGHGRI